MKLRIAILSYLFGLYVIPACAQVSTTGSSVLAAKNLFGVLVLGVPPTATGSTLTTDTAANICAVFTINGATPPSVGPTLLTIANNGAGTITIAGGTGVSIVGTATIAVNTSRLFLHYGTCGASPTWTFKSIGSLSGL
jgi:hypothetical protein